MAFDPREAEVKAWTDEFSARIEHVGLPPVVGRILAHLMICVPPEQSSAQLAEACKASKGAVSGAARMLTQMGLVERARKPGDRAAYFRVGEDAWSYLLHAEVLKARMYKQLAAEGLDLLADASPAHRRRLQEFYEFNRFFERELPALVERWDALWKEKTT